MSYPLIFADFLVAGLLILGIHYPRHRRADMVLAFVAVNVGVLACIDARDVVRCERWCWSWPLWRSVDHPSSL